jgi:hypothetical protein
MKMKGVLGAVVVVVMMVCWTPVSAENFNPALPAPAPVLGAGWASDQISFASTDSADSPYVFTLSSPAYFRITDAFLVKDTYWVYEGASIILTTTLFSNPSGFGDNPTADAAWMSSTFTHGEIILAAGPHSLRVQGDGLGGLPAGFFTRLDAVPEPLTLLLLGFGLAGLAGLRRKE